MCVIICNHNGHNGDIDTDHDKIIDLGNFDDARGDTTPNLIEPFKNKLNHSKLGFELGLTVLHGFTGTMFERDMPGARNCSIVASANRLLGEMPRREVCLISPQSHKGLAMNVHESIHGNLDIHYKDSRDMRYITIIIVIIIIYHGIHLFWNMIMWHSVTITTQQMVLDDHKPKKHGRSYLRSQGFALGQGVQLQPQWCLRCSENLWETHWVMFLGLAPSQI